ncbi:MAG: aldo/keto reductase [Pseudomonadota bacterium]
MNDIDMDYTTLGQTGLRVSVAGLGCGGNSRLGLTRGQSEADCIAVVERAIDLGVNFFDTAEAYGTEAVVGKAMAGHPRDQMVISTKARIVKGDELMRPPAVRESLEASLKRLQTDYVDVFHLHGVIASRYDYALHELYPELDKAKAQGKIRHIGITEAAAQDATHDMLHRATQSDPWEVVMFAFHMMSQNARPLLLPTTQARGIGTLLMFVVRNIFSQPTYLHRVVEALRASGDLSEAIDPRAPFDFALGDGGAQSVVDAAYRFARHEPGADVVLFGTGNVAHVEANVRSIVRPPLANDITKMIYERFGHLVDVGLDAPQRKPPPLR